MENQTEYKGANVALKWRKKLWICGKKESASIDRQPIQTYLPVSIGSFFSLFQSRQTKNCLEVNVCERVEKKTEPCRSKIKW